MDLNSDQMILLAKIEFLEKENDALKEERVTSLTKTRTCSDFSKLA